MASRPRPVPDTNPIPASALPTVQWAAALAAVPVFAAVEPPQDDEPVFAELFWETVQNSQPRGESQDEQNPTAAARELRRTPDRGRRR